MTVTSVAYSTLTESKAAGRELGDQLRAGLAGLAPDVVITFVSPDFDYSELLSALQHACEPGILVGCSSAGEFMSGAQGANAACAIALIASEMQFSAGIGRGLSWNLAGGVQQVVSAFQGTHRPEYVYRSALVFADGLSCQAESLVDQLNLLTGGTYQFIGGGAADNARFESVHVFHGTEAVSDAVVALEILSKKPLGFGVAHGWDPAGPRMRVTEAEGKCLVSMDAIPAVEVYDDFAVASAMRFDHENPLPFFLHNVIGVETGTGHALRVPLAIRPDGAFNCATEVPSGATVRIMNPIDRGQVDAAAAATRAAISKLQGHRPKAALFFDCVATRFRLGKDFGVELKAVQEVLGDAQYVGCNTYGQIARAEGQFSGFHNCTAVVCVIPE